MKNLNYIKNVKNLLCLNGKIPKEKNFYKNFNMIIAADGAANDLCNMDIIPDYVIGDLDSIKHKILKKIPPENVIKLISQDKSDFEKSVDYIKDKFNEDFIVTGVEGGFIDHFIYNLNIILLNNLSFYSKPFYGIVLENDEFNFTLKKNQRISFFGYNNTKIFTSGLKWNLSGEIFSFPGFGSISNYNIEEKISLKVTGKILFLYEENF